MTHREELQRNIGRYARPTRSVDHSLTRGGGLPTFQDSTDARSVARSLTRGGGLPTFQDSTDDIPLNPSVPRFPSPIMHPIFSKRALTSHCPHPYSASNTPFYDIAFGGSFWKNKCQTIYFRNNYQRTNSEQHLNILKTFVFASAQLSIHPQKSRFGQRLKKIKRKKI